MSPQKTEFPSDTSFYNKNELKQYHKQQIIKEARKFKKEAVEAANAPMSSCAIIAVMILAAIIAPPLVLVLL